MSAKPFLLSTIDSLLPISRPNTQLWHGFELLQEPMSTQSPISTPLSSVCLSGLPVSPWSKSGSKRIFDLACVLMSLPFLIPLLLLIAAMVRLSSTGPILFRQKRIGLHGMPFTILKFRTLFHSSRKANPAVTTAASRQVTPVGRLLRRWKLDELPQLLNVLCGEMSLVGPRPKMPEFTLSRLPCGPGITGAATLVFAREEAVLDRVPKHRLDACIHTVVLPAKRRLDAEYMACATFLTELKLIVDTLLWRCDNRLVERLIKAAIFDAAALSRTSDSPLASATPRKPVAQVQDWTPGLEQGPTTYRQPLGPNKMQA